MWKHGPLLPSWSHTVDRQNTGACSGYIGLWKEKELVTPLPSTSVGRGADLKAQTRWPDSQDGAAKWEESKENQRPLKHSAPLWLWPVKITKPPCEGVAPPKHTWVNKMSIHSFHFDTVYWKLVSTRDGGPCLLTQVQESIFQISLDFLLDALQHVIRAVALVPFEY